VSGNVFSRVTPAISTDTFPAAAFFVAAQAVGFQHAGMRMKILAAGRPALGYAKLAIEEYTRRLSRFGRVDLEFVKAGPPGEVSRSLLKRSEGSYRVVLDERGELPGTRQLAKRISALEMRGDIKSVAFLIGAADGHSEELRSRADFILSLSRLTLQHELALVVLLEQLYRIADLRRGGPYHRD
jgi:23S rRNA (pseudouridine1915-N3)-methyltransferase